MDLNVFTFDHDLTLAIVLANADGTVYHRYGGRESLSPMNMGTLVNVMRDGLHTHLNYQKRPDPPELGPPFHLDEIVQNRLHGRIQPVMGCYHCHYAREAKQYLMMESGAWTPDQYWIYPETKRIGLIMDQLRQNRVSEVILHSPAAKAGLQTGDVLKRVGGKRVLTKYDIQWILHETDPEASSLSFVAEREEQRVEGQLELAPEWKVGDPADYLWRVRNVYTRHMEKFLPAPGFIGESLSVAEQSRQKLPEPNFALKITALNAGTHLAGIRIGDVVTSAAGRSRFDSVRDFHAWCEALRRKGRDIRMQVFRQGEELNVMVPLSSLNYSRVEKAPKVVLGFIVQQLSGGAGLRVGNVTERGSAERAGVVVGDRIAMIDGRRFNSRAAVVSYLHDKAPGDLLTVDLIRNGVPRQVGFVLSGEEARQSKVARLTEPVSHDGQELACVIAINVPEEKHIYSMHQKGFGVSTNVSFRGVGYELLGTTQEPSPEKVELSGMDPMWIHRGRVEFRQRIRVTDSERFQLLLQVYAQVCDEQRCHEFRAVVGSDGAQVTFTDYQGRFQSRPEIRVHGGNRETEDVDPGVSPN